MSGPGNKVEWICTIISLALMFVTFTGLMYGYLYH